MCVYSKSKHEVRVSQVLKMQWIVPQIFKLLPKRHIFFDLVIRFMTNRKYAFFCIFYVRLSADNIILIYWIKIDSYKWSWLTVVELSIHIDSEQIWEEWTKLPWPNCPVQHNHPEVRTHICVALMPSGSYTGLLLLQWHDLTLTV